MPSETKEAIDWALQQTDNEGNAISVDTAHSLVDKVREYFNDNAIDYATFSYSDLVPYLPTSE